MAEKLTALAWWLPMLLPPYLLLCSTLRYRRRDEMQRRFPDRHSMKGMTNVEAQQIVNKLSEFEFPFTVLTSLQFALFKTYGIPTISKLLAETQQLSHASNSSKRYADTNVLIQEFSDHHPTSDRTIKAIARMNYIHSRYQKAGKISNDDMLYTLSVFITEPIAWVEKYEWRAMTDTEKNAMGTFWKSIGDAMEISYHPLTRTKWADGIEFYEDIRDWAQRYEISDMVPAATNKKIADELVPLLLNYVPSFLRPYATQIVGAVMGDHLRKAMIYPTPPSHYFSIVHVIFEARRYFLRYLSLPRPSFMAVKGMTDEKDPDTGRYHLYNYLVDPYYVKPGFWNRWGPEAWFVYFSGGQVPGSKGSLYSPQGYVMEEVGPASMKNKGLKEMQDWEEKIRTERPLGCPFTFSR